MSHSEQHSTRSSDFPNYHGHQFSRNDTPETVNPATQGPVRDVTSAMASATLTPIVHLATLPSDDGPQAFHNAFKADFTSNTPDAARDISSVTNPPASSEAPSSPSSPVPRLSRAYSTPLPQQITHWQRPRRLQSSLSDVHSRALTDRHFQDLALELADSVQQTVQTLFQLSPPHIFDLAKEQFSSCAVQIPTPSLSALLTSMKHLNYISANMQTLGIPDAHAFNSEAIMKDEFDIGEILQSVGDSFSGLASDAEVDVVLHHGDAIQHMGVKGDECGISYALTHVVHQILATAQSGDSLEIGLSISGSPNTELEHSSKSSTAPEFSSPVNDFLACTFDIAHKFLLPEVALSDGGLSPEAKGESFTEPENPDEESSSPSQAFRNTLTRLEPSFDSIILRRLLSRINGILQTETTGGPDATTTKGRRFQLALNLERGPPLSVLHKRHTPIEDDDCRDNMTSNIPLAQEPSLEELMIFAETLRGKEAAFHASSKSTFAHHLTRYLASWGVVVAHIPTDVAEEQDFWDDSLDEGIPTLTTQNIPVRNFAVNNNAENPISMIIIDDDVHALRRRLLKYRAETASNIPGRKRPSLNHRTKSSPSIRNVLLAASVQSPAPQPPPTPFTPTPIIHFTSLTRYKLVKDVIQGIIFSPGTLPLLPEVIVIPKPAGPRRILTALHTAMTKPIVDSFFSPIATSPMSPGVATPMSTNTASSSRSKQSTTAAPVNSRNVWERTVRSNSESHTVSSSSPLSQQDTFEYFAEEAVQLGDSPASGVVIPSIDGRPKILFQPQSRSGSSKSESPATDPNSLRPSRRPGKSFSRTSESVPRVAPGGRPKSTSDPRTSRYLQAISPMSSSGGPLLNPTEFGRTVKTPAVFDSSTVEQLRTVASMSWQEATKHLAMTPVVIPGGDDIAEPINSASPAESPPIRSSTSSKVSRTSPPSPEQKVTLKQPPPLSKSASSGKGKKTSTASNGIVPPINVLIVEDNPINQTHYTTVLRRNSIKYEVAWNGREAVEKWQKGNFHLILMDIQMPIMDGIAATKEIRRLETLNELGEFSPTGSDSSMRTLGTPNSRNSTLDTTPFRSQVIIVALTASSLQSDRVAALAAGCNDFLTKPVDNDWLIDKIIEWGSIKALQMWAEIRPQIAGAIDHGQAVQAQTVAERLHVPSEAIRNSPERLTKPLPDAKEKSSIDTKESTPTLTFTEPQEDLGDERSDGSSDAMLTSEVPHSPQRPQFDPIQVSGETALLHYVHQSQNFPQVTEGLVTAAPTTTSIASILHKTPSVGQIPVSDPPDDPNQPPAGHNLKDP